MRVLVTGGTGVIGTPTVRRLLDAGHSVRLLSRHAASEAKGFVSDVEPVETSVTDDLSGVAEGCDAVVHIAGIVSETPELSFADVNVTGTMNLVREAERAGVKRFVYVSSLGVDTGTSGYHESKRQAEAVVERCSGEWVILRPGNVYGPGDEVVSLYVRMVQTLPAVPIIDGGNHKAQPIWAGDVAEAIVKSLEEGNISGRTLELGGPDLVSTNDILDILEILLHKKPARIPVPSWAATMGSTFISSLGLPSPFSPDQITMLVEGNRIAPGQPNGLVTLGVEPTSIERGLKMLLETVPIQTVPDSTEAITESRYEIHIGETALDASEMMDLVKRNIDEVFGRAPLVANSERRLERGENIIIEMPVRGQVNVRVVHDTPTSMTCAPVKGHPLVGAVTFECLEQPEGLMFRVVTYTASAGLADAAMMASGACEVQSVTWEQVLQNVVRLSGGVPVSEVRESQKILSQAEAAEVREALRELETAWKRDPQNPARLI